ncbi:YdeI/OmpD-associated family protein [Larkinella soli]|uniref:YdeI/OmpD-associated family protein n=1 Tax=Larkinella soli TaxID=1770527 RepID=UPI000FFC4704|nr:YdeI/OmpD-associated family protein [Larkinella soli]
MQHIIFFPTPADLRRWFEENHETEKEVQVGYYKVGSGKPSITWPESVDEALCFGWIDGVRHRIDEESYTIRFTPRKAKSIWSTVNINRVAELTQQGRMRPEGLAAFEKRDEKKSGIYGYEREDTRLSEEFEAQLRANEAAWAFLQTQAPYYRKTAGHWVMSAKQEATRLKRLASLIECSARGEKLPQYRYSDKKA